jgi:hypothetical protein
LNVRGLQALGAADDFNSTAWRHSTTLAIRLDRGKMYEYIFPVWRWMKPAFAGVEPLLFLFFAHFVILFSLKSYRCPAKPEPWFPPLLHES